MKKVFQLISMILVCTVLLTTVLGLTAFAGDDTIIVSGLNGDATRIEKGTSMILVASGVSQGKAVTWSVTDLDGAETDLASVEPISTYSCIFKASKSEYGTVKVTATQNDASGIEGEIIIRITNENLVTVDDADSSITYVSSGSGVEWTQIENSGYYLGTGKSVIPPEDGSYSDSEPAYAEFTFTGTGIQWISESNYFCGVAEVYIDGEKVSTVDSFTAPRIINQFVNFSMEDLPYGEHTIKIVATGLKNAASTQYPGTSVLIDAFRYITEAPQAQPIAVLTGPDSVKPNASFTLSLSVDNVPQDLYAERITLSYDPEVFEYDAEVTTGDDIIGMRLDPIQGILDIAAANINGVQGSSVTIGNIGFKVKAGVKNTSSTISVTNAELGIGPDGELMEAGLTSKTIIIEDEGGSTVDKSGLQNAINDAEELFDNAVVGIENGCYWEADKHAFKAAIDDAKAVLDDPNASQPTVDTATNDLRAAIAVFEASAINPSTGDIDNSSTIDVADLAKVAYFFGSKSGDPNWDEAVIADINKDGIISIDDLAFIASRM
jgi:hypothetical protein